MKAVESMENRSASTVKSIEWSTVSKAALRSNKTERDVSIVGGADKVIID